MSRQIRAIYENGVIRPLEAVALDEGETLDVVLLTCHTNGRADAARVLADIARLPLEGEQKDNFSGAEHDRVIYSTDKQ